MEERERPDNDMTRKLRPLQGEDDADIDAAKEDDAHASDLDDMQDGPTGKLCILFVSSLEHT